MRPRRGKPSCEGIIEWGGEHPPLWREDGGLRRVGGKVETGRKRAVTRGTAAPLHLFCSLGWARARNVKSIVGDSGRGGPGIGTTSCSGQMEPPQATS